MAERSSPCAPERNFKEAVCIHTKKIYDACKEQE